jgi:hypothetical protein
MYTTHTHTLQHSHVGWALTWESCAVLCIIHSALTRESNAVYSIYAVCCVHWIFSNISLHTCTHYRRIAYILSHTLHSHVSSICCGLRVLNIFGYSIHTCTHYRQIAYTINTHCSTHTWEHSHGSYAVYSIYAVGCVHWILLAVVFGRTHAHITGG